MWLPDPQPVSESLRDGAIFWFDPMVWWIGARMVEERERACDESVLSLGSEPRVADERISARKALLALVAILTIATPLIVGIVNAPLIRAQSAPRPQLEAASVKRCRPGDVPPGGRGGEPPSFSPGRMTLNCRSVMGLINAAYVLYADGRNFSLLRLPRIPIEGGPGWIASELYTVNAKAENQANAYVMQGPMLQTLLENRFKLKIHRETREIPVYNLVIAKGGPKLKPFQEGSCTPMPPMDFTKLPLSVPGLPPGQRYCQAGGGAKGPNFDMRAEGVTLDDFARLLGPGRPVVNKTGIKGVFEIHLEFGLNDDARQKMTELTGVDPGESNLPSAFVAIQEQLGLKLESAKGQGEFLVIDYIERPDEN